MSGAQSWSVKGIDPKVREAAREAAARQGMSLGEYLSQALQTHHGGAPTATPTSAQTPTPRPRRVFGVSAFEDGDADDWSISGPTTMPRPSDPARLAQRIETIERRTQLAVTGLDRAVSTIDRSVLGLAARIEDAEAISTEASERIAEAIDQFRIAGETLSGRLQHAEEEAHSHRDALIGARTELTDAKHRLESQVSIADEVARRAEAAAAYLTTEMETRDAALNQTLAEARTVAEEAARQAAAASADAVSELRRLQDEMSERLAETESSTRRAVESAIEDVKTDAAKGARDALLSEVSRLESEITKRLGAADALKAEQAALIARIERAEAGSREATAGLRQAAGAAIADLRNAQLTLAARLKQVEETGGGGAGVDLTGVRQQQQDIAERLAALETRSAHSPVAEALDAFEKRIAEIEAGGAVRTLDDSLQRLAERMAETESTANTAIRTLEETVSALGARVEANTGVQETEKLRAMLESRLDAMASSVHDMVGQAREELTGQVQAALAGAQDEGLEGALADVNRRLAAAERRQAQTIEAISLEIKRMSETVDKRLRSVEARNDDAAASAVREELSRMSTTLEQRFDEIERREAAAFDRMGLEVGRLSERLEDRVGAVETRSAQAIEHVGEQVARMAERFNARHETLVRDLGERMIDSEERSTARVSEAIGSIMQRLAEVEEHSAEAIAPVQKAVSSVASKLELFESGHAAGEAVQDFLPTPARRTDDFTSFGESEFASFGEPEPYVAPSDAAKPLRAGPLPPRSFDPPAPQAQDSDLDIYFAEEAEDLVLTGEGGVDGFTPPQTPSFSSGDDDLLIDDHALDDADVFVTPPPQDEDPFWTPEDGPPAAQPAANVDAREEEALDAAVFDVSPGAEAPLALSEPPPPPGKNDYLANARKAAQAQSTPPTKQKEHKEKERAPTYSLRGQSRVVLWGATGVMALLLAGGAWYYNQQQQQQSAPPTPQAPEPQHTLPTSEETAPFGAPPVDPFSQAPAQGATGEAPAPETPIAHAAPLTAPAAAAPAQPSVVAGPLAPRNVSLEQAAQSGNLVAQYELSLQRLGSGRTREGVAMLRAAADRGLVMAQYRMAKLYERGEGVTADLNTARAWTERAAAGGNRRAMHDLGVYFARGEGAPLDEAAAFRWFRQAAELGVADSQYNLGVLYQQGRGVNANPGEALFWFSVAARQGDQDAAARATSLESTVAPTQVEQARARAQSFRPRAAIAVANGDFGPRPWAQRPAT
jgi:localization factor PodJL